MSNTMRSLSSEEIAELLSTAEERAATEVEPWIPVKPGDHMSGIVVEVGSITTKYGIYATTTVVVHGDAISDGKALKLNPNSNGEALLRAGWMGAVLVAQYDRMRPVPGDLVAFHYQKDVTPQSGMNDYALVVAVVIDPRTGMSKVPVNDRVQVPTEAQLRNADPRTGEIPPANSLADKVGTNPATEPLRPGETPL